MLSLWVVDQWHSGGMFSGISDKHAQTSFMVPLRNGVIVLQLGVEDIDWATKDMSPLDGGARGFRSRPQLFRGPAG